jgi:site-specific recombinase XerD
MVAKRQLLKRRLDNDEGITFNQLYDDFIFGKKGLVADATLDSYKRNLKAFRDYLDTNNIFTTKQMNSKQMGLFREFLLDKYPNHSTINTYLRSSAGTRKSH